MERALRQCAQPGCPELSASGACPRHRRDGRKGAYGGEWPTFSAQWLRLHPTCVRCGKPATLTDHVKMVNAGGRIMGNRYQSMCQGCHNKRNAAITNHYQARRRQ